MEGGDVGSSSVAREEGRELAWYNYGASVQYEALGRRGRNTSGFQAITRQTVKMQNNFEKILFGRDCGNISGLTLP